MHLAKINNSTYSRKMYILIKDRSNILYEDNTACITQIRRDYIKGDKTKDISPKFFYTHELQKSDDIDVQLIYLIEIFLKYIILDIPFLDTVRYGDTTILRKVVYKYGGDICCINFFIYIIMHIFFIYC